LKEENKETRASGDVELSESGEVCNIPSPWIKETPKIREKSEMAAANSSEKAEASAEANISARDTGKLEGHKSTSPEGSMKKKSSHKRTRSSDQVVELKVTDIKLTDIDIGLKANGSGSPAMSPIEWETLEQANKVSQIRSIILSLFVGFIFFTTSRLVVGGASFTRNREYVNNRQQ